METTRLFNPRWTFLAIIVIAVLFMAMFYFSFEDEPVYSPNSKVDLSADKSPIGRMAFIEFLKLNNYPVNSKPFGQIVSADYDTSLVIYFLSADDSPAELRDHFQQVQNGKGPLIILPKWKRRADKGKSKFVADTLPPNQVNALVNAVCNTNDAQTVISSGNDLWVSQFTSNPIVKHPQSILLNGLQPAVANNSSVFYGTYTNLSGGKLNILADPDIVSNYALKEPANTMLAMQIVLSLLPGEVRSIIIANHDDSGVAKANNPLTALFHFPSNILVIYFFILVAALIWMGRWKSMKFQSIQKGGNRKELLIHAFGSYFSFGKISNQRIAQKYFQIKIRQASRLVSASSGLDEKQQMEWLRKFSRLKGSDNDYDSIQNEIRTASGMSHSELLRIANRIFNLTDKLTRK